MENIYGVIEKPIRTERSVILKEKGNRYVFRVRRTATKPEIKKAVEELFHVEVNQVRTMILAGKVRRVSKSVGRKPDWKKAIVSVKEGQTIKMGEKS